MNQRKVIGILLGASILVFGLGFVLTDPETYGICNPDQYYSCTSPMLNNIGQPLFMDSIALFIVFLLLFFLPSVYFKAWLKYAAWFIPVAVVWIISSDVTCGGGLGLGICFDKELATWWSSGIYLVLSLIVIASTLVWQPNKPAR